MHNVAHSLDSYGCSDDTETAYVPGVMWRRMYLEWCEVVCKRHQH